LLTERESNWDKKIDLKFSWIKPLPGWYKLNIDGTFNKNDANGGIGGIFRNRNGDWILGFTSKIISRTLINSELMALYQGLCIAKDRKLFPLEIESDATHVITFIKEGCKAYESIINSCRMLLSQMDTMMMHHNFRQGNEAAHILVKHARDFSAFNKIELLFLPPPFVMNRMLAD
ncbi:hypothetical protein A4A49_63691, partial [Nicotiana attenuata]